MSSNWYYSLNKQSPSVSFKQATISGQAPDKGLYFPTQIPKYEAGKMKTMLRLSKEEIGYEVMRPFVGDDIPEHILREIIAYTVGFPFPLVALSNEIYTLELFHGPTLAFKDVGARFMSRCLGYFNRNEHTKTTVLVATSGDTGGAVASGFLGEESVEVIILYPKEKVSPVQELQLTTCGQNIIAIAVDGNFDSCQSIVKNAFADTTLNTIFKLTSANSINVARWLPQQLYYFYALQQWMHDDAPVIAVPSGNFGNICGGILAKASGLLVKHFIAACNANDTVPTFFETHQYKEKPSVATISNAMDVGNPSNFIRILELFKSDFSALQKWVSSSSISDETTRVALFQLYSQYNYIADPHGAVGFHALNEYLQANKNNKGIFLETAHPVKFPEVVSDTIHQAPQVPEAVLHLYKKDKQSISMPSEYQYFFDWMMSRKK